ncbi:TetR/AcrR family transcriptional regulator [Mycolicibacterium hodleri]|uniref:TetR/AcrR family transcriptional regulator n=1 Tax=Mycolicibacterium hodleri TaxID=49897 RepID=A0A502EK01_9MYCO|nr:TetR/AcrR family transcriptional regulator [Mycolicibacterium hodleri]TPG36661.1 TetR/AcrR family transcriptional regulator [Mycolicibacterium hodleri]
MRPDSARPSADPGQRRAALKQKRSHATQRSLVHAAVALWRTNGYASTTVADICRAAGVSKSLFFFYFPRKEDLLAEMGVISTQTAHRVAHELLKQGPSYEMAEVITAVLASLEQQIRRNPPDLIVEIILEGYRQEHRILMSGQLRDDAPYMFAELFQQAQADGKLTADVDVWHLAGLAQSIVTEGARHWAAGAYGEKSLIDVVGGDIALLVAGCTAR